MFNDQAAKKIPTKSVGSITYKFNRPALYATIIVGKGGVFANTYKEH